MDIRKAQFSADEVNEAKNRLYQHIKKDHNAKDQIDSAAGGFMRQDLAGTVLHGAEFNRSRWVSVDMNGLAANGTKWTDCDFLGCDMKDASIQYCEFSSDVLLNCPIKGTNLSNTAFFSTALEATTIRACSFVDAEFTNCYLHACDISRSTFELCRFRDSVIEDIDFRYINLPYAYLDNVSLIDVNLPFMQIPYMYYGLQSLFDPTNKVGVSTHLNEGVLEPDEYRSYLPDFVIYFADNHEYFPWANCLEIEGEHELALQRCIEGIRHLSKSHSYRMLYQLCLLAIRVLRANRSQREEIASEINAMPNEDSLLSAAERFQLAKYYPRMKQLIYDNPMEDLSLDIAFQTNIAGDDYESLALFMKFLDALAQETETNSDGRTVELRHNSPFLVDWLTSGGYQQCLDIINTISTYVEVVGNRLGPIANLVTVGGAGIAAIKRLRRRSGRRTNAEQSEEHPTENSTVPDSPMDMYENRRDDFERLARKIEAIERRYNRGADNSVDDAAVKAPSSRLAELVLAMRGRGIEIEDMHVHVLDKSIS